jgi:methionyl aminopeptidase
VSTGAVRTPAEIDSMRTSGGILAAVLSHLEQQIATGMITAELDALAAAETKRLGGEAAFLGHEGFSKSICISVNDQVVHGIPGGRAIEDGDVVGLDFGVRYQGMITDSAITVAVGEITSSAARLLKVTEEALYAGIDAATAGHHVGDVSAAIERHLRQANLGIIRELAGHGVGRELWEDPQVLNYGRAGSGPVLKAGQTIAIEPMASLGSPAIQLLADHWTIATRDGSLTAQFEHTILITDGPAEILTARA